jgi:hypothetical protein
MIKRKEILISFLFIILLVLPLIAFSQDEEACRHLEVPIPGLTSTCLPALPDYIVAIYNFALMIIGIICFGALLYGGLRYLTSVGKPAAISDAKDQIFSALLGLIILFSSYLILKTINPELVILSQAPPETKGCININDCPSLICKDGRCGYLKDGEWTEYLIKLCSKNEECELECKERICSYKLTGGVISSCSNYFTYDDCTREKNPDGTDKCQWCPTCSDNKINQWGIDKCVDNTAKSDNSECGYKCVVEKCGAKSCE